MKLVKLVKPFLMAHGFFFLRLFIPICTQIEPITNFVLSFISEHSLKHYDHNLDVWIHIVRKKARWQSFWGFLLMLCTAICAEFVKGIYIRFFKSLLMNYAEKNIQSFPSFLSYLDENMFAYYLLSITYISVSYFLAYKIVDKFLPRNA